MSTQTNGRGRPRFKAAERRKTITLTISAELRTALEVEAEASRRSLSLVADTWLARGRLLVAAERALLGFAYPAVSEVAEMPEERARKEGLPPKIARALVSAGIDPFAIEVLAAMTKEDLLSVPGLGRASVRELSDWIYAHSAKGVGA